MEYTPQDILFHWENRQEGVTQSTMAEDMGLTLGQFKYRLDKARQELKEGTTTQQGTTTVKEDGPNYQEATSRGKRIKSIDALIEAIGIDLEEWEVYKPEVTTWEAFRADKNVNLEYQDGRTTGYVIDEGKIRTETLYRVHAKFIRKHPISVWPTVQPVLLPSLPSRQRASEPKRHFLGTALHIPDIQLGLMRKLPSGRLEPIHDRNAISVVWEVAKLLQPEYIFILGDYLDLADWSNNFIRSPEFYFTTQPSIFEGAWWLWRLREAAPSSRIIYLEGNHEKRITRALMENMQASYMLRSLSGVEDDPSLSIPRMLDLKQLDIEYHGDYPNNPWWLNNRLKVEHGDITSGKPGTASQKLSAKAPVSTVFGHGHKLEQIPRVIEDGREVVYTQTTQAGCLCRLDYVVPGHKRGQQWQQGFAISHFDEKEFNETQAYRIDEGKTIFRGDLIQSTFDIDELNEDLHRTGVQY